MATTTRTSAPKTAAAKITLTSKTRSNLLSAAAKTDKSIATLHVTIAEMEKADDGARADVTAALADLERASLHLRSIL